MTFRVARRLIGGGWYGAARRRVRGAGPVLELQVRARRRARQLRGAARGARALGVRAPPRRAPRPRSLPRPSPARCCGRRSGRSSGSTGSGSGSPSRALRARLVVLAALVPALWFLPEWWGSGDPFRAGARANNPNPGSAAFAEHPALELVSRFRKVVIAPVKARHHHRLRLRARDVGAAAGARGSTLARRGRLVRLVRARGRDDRGRLRRQPALPDRDHGRRVRARRPGRRAGAPGGGLARARASSRTSAPARSPPRRRSSSAWRSSRRSSSRRPTTPAGCRAGCATRRSCGTTSRA